MLAPGPHRSRAFQTAPLIPRKADQYRTSYSNSGTMLAVASLHYLVRVLPEHMKKETYAVSGALANGIVTPLSDSVPFGTVAYSPSARPFGGSDNDNLSCDLVLASGDLDTKSNSTFGACLTISLPIT